AHTAVLHFAADQRTESRCDKIALVSAPSTSRPAMLTIGLLGGMSWESSAHCYRLLNERVRERLGRRLADLARGLEAAGADLMLICAHTMQLVADQVQAELNIPLIDIADATAQAVQPAGRSSIGLPGTAFTMEQPCYLERLEQHGRTVLVPEQTDSPVPVFPTTRLPVESALDAAFAVPAVSP
ncbi:MAG TPA: aspartate/glutamate racemase family protein, partial [Propionibacteriaceae bacterium]|nr:aspartate/glutamate racemase family protein [Propionibacteriaceae bacterium]